MKKMMVLATVALMVGGVAQAAGMQSDARTAYESAVKSGSVKYRCQQGKTLTVQYGFNKKGQPTYAVAKLNGKARFMPINYHTSDITSTNFGDENNFSLSADPMTWKNFRKAGMSIQSPSSEILYKLCEPRKK